MGTYTGTIGDDTITPSIVSPGVFRDPPETLPSAAADLIKGFGGIDTIDGGDGDDDIVSGTGGDPVAVADGGADTINGGAGDDTIIDDSQAVGNVLHGDAGNDRILGLAGGVGADTIYGGAGDDQIYAGWVGNVLHGDAGNDVINIAIIDTGGANPATNTAWGDDGNDRIDLSYTTNSGNFSWVGQGPTGTIKLDGGAGDDQIFVDAPVDTLLNMAGTTVFLYGGTGNDMIYGNDGNDQIYGGRSDDDREDGPDRIYGNDGDDNVWAGGGDDVVYGGAGDDKLAGQAGNDTIYGGTGNDHLGGGTGNDSLQGDSGADVLTGRDGVDMLLGGRQRPVRLRVDRRLQARGDPPRRGQRLRRRRLGRGRPDRSVDHRRQHGRVRQPGLRLQGRRRDHRGGPGARGRLWDVHTDPGEHRRDERAGAGDPGQGRHGASHSVGCGRLHPVERLALTTGRQVVDLLAVEDGVGAHERDVPLGGFARRFVDVFPPDTVGVDDERAALALAHLRRQRLAPGGRSSRSGRHSRLRPRPPTA